MSVTTSIRSSYLILKYIQKANQTAETNTMSIEHFTTSWQEFVVASNTWFSAIQFLHVNSRVERLDQASRWRAAFAGGLLTQNQHQTLTMTHGLSKMGWHSGPMEAQIIFGSSRQMPCLFCRNTVVLTWWAGNTGGAYHLLAEDQGPGDADLRVSARLQAPRGGPGPFLAGGAARQPGAVPEGRRSAFGRRNRVPQDAIAMTWSPLLALEIQTPGALKYSKAAGTHSKFAKTWLCAAPWNTFCFLLS